MTQKIFNTLQKIPPTVRSVWGALIVALLVHLLLALLFRHTPAQSRYDSGELSKVGRIVLSDKSNAEFAEWMKNHDPAVMTISDPVLGYSSVLNSAKLRTEPEDLPNLMQPVIPQKKSGIHQIGQLKVANNNLLMPYSSKRNGIFAKSNGVQLPVVVNGEYSSQLAAVLPGVLAELPPDKLSAIRQLPETIVEIVPGRFAGTMPRIVLQKSCGNGELDRKAVETIYKYILKNAGDAGHNGKVLFIWRNVRLPETVGKEQKI